MKKYIIIVQFFLLSNTGFSQNFNFEYSERLTPSVKKEILNRANLIGEIMPDFSSNFKVPYNERTLLNEQLDQRTILDRYVLTDNQRMRKYSLEDYTRILEYVSIEISANKNGKILTSQSTNENLTVEQKNILNIAEFGANITVNIKFRYKNKAINSGKLIEGEYVVTAVPQTEAEYPGGYKQISEYYNNNVINQITAKKTSRKVMNAIVKFTIDEEGQIVNAEISRTSTDPEIDKLLLDATNKMPKWRPAENSKGIKVKQEFSIPFGGIGC